MLTYHKYRTTCLGVLYSQTMPCIATNSICDRWSTLSKPEHCLKKGSHLSESFFFFFFFVTSCMVIISIPFEFGTVIFNISGIKDLQICGGPLFPYRQYGQSTVSSSTRIIHNNPILTKIRWIKLLKTAGTVWSVRLGRKLRVFSPRACPNSAPVC